MSIFLSVFSSKFFIGDKIASFIIFFEDVSEIRYVSLIMVIKRKKAVMYRSVILFCFFPFGWLFLITKFYKIIVMNDMFSNIGKFLIFLGFLILILGLVFSFFPKLPYLGRLPGDIYIKKGNFTFYMPLATSIFISLILTLIVNLILKK